MSYIFISARNNEEGKLDFAYLQTDDSLKFLSEEVLPFEENKEKIHNILTNQDIGIIAWQGYDDCRSLLNEFKERGVEPFDFQLFDVRYMLNVIEEDDDEYELESFIPLSLQKKETHSYPLKRCYFILYALKNILFSLGDNFENFLKRNDFESCFYYSLDAYLGINPKEVFSSKQAVKELLEKDIEYYVFFDFECANCLDKIGKICEIGALITDTSFNIVKEIHHPINPNSEFHLLSSDKIHGLHLFWEANDYKAYRKAPTLPYFYDEFKTLFSDEKAIYVGHAVDNDISFLYTDLKRNGLEEFSVHAIDTQRMYRKLIDKTSKKSISLENALIALLGEEELQKYTPHKSLDDAKMTLAVFRAILEKSEMTITEILTMFPRCLRSTEQIDLSFALKEASYTFPLPYNSASIVLSSPEDLYCGYTAENTSERIYLEACRDDFEKSRIKTYQGRRFFFQSFIKKRDAYEVEQLISKVKEKEGILVNNPLYADVIVYEKSMDIKRVAHKKGISVKDLLS